jgi:hypothetical protein
LVINTSTAVYYLKNIKKIEEVYSLLNESDLSKNEKSGII